MVEFLVIGIFAGLQSIFGIGVLFFGTPTLILLGFPFAETLSVVLPASLAISSLQVFKGGFPASQWRANFAIWCLIPMALTIGAGLWFNWDVELEFFVAAMLLCFVVVRFTDALHALIRHNARQRPRRWLAVIGIVHGLSNLGGGLLAIFVLNTFADKKVIRSHIAFCHLCFATIQFSVLCVVTPGVIHLGQLGYAALAAVVFWILERRVFAQIPMPVFDRTFTALIGGYSALVFAKLAGILEIPAA